jgi:antitoxin PrlF
LTATITSKGQITIPAEVRRRLGVTSRDGLAFVLDEGQEIRIRPSRRDITALAGAAGKLRDTLTWNEVLNIAHEDATDPVE